MRVTVFVPPGPSSFATTRCAPLVAYARPAFSRKTQPPVGIEYMVPQSLARSPNFAQFTQRPPKHAARLLASTLGPWTAEIRHFQKQAHYFSNPAREEQGMSSKTDRASTLSPSLSSQHRTPRKKQLQKNASLSRYVEVNKKNHSTYFVLHAQTKEGSCTQTNN